MTSQVSSLESTGGILATWRDFASFLRRPRLPDRAAAPSPSSLRRMLALLALDIAIMVPLILLALGAEALGVEFPDNALDELEFNTQQILLIVFAIPLFEELLFRGWLSGRPGHVGAMAALAAGVVVAAMAGGSDVPGAGIWGVIAGLTFFAGAAIVLALKVRAGPWLWFRRLFPLFFWGSTLSFALIHIFNYDTATSLVSLLPLVIPQFIAGLLLGYARVTLGLWACCVLHFLHNGLLVAGVLAFGM